MNVRNESGNAMDAAVVRPGMEALVVFSTLTYLVCIVCGIMGNGAVIVMVLRVMRNSTPVVHVHVYVLALSVVDLLYALTGPLIVAYMLSHTWLFGLLMCKMVYAFEGLNKTFSVYMLVVLSVDRYLGVCHATTSAAYRSVSAATRVVVVVLAVALLTNVPIYMFAVVDQHAAPVTICGLVFPRSATTSIFANYYTVFLFVFYFLLPTALIVYFYARALMRLRRQVRLLRKRTMRHYRIIKYVAVVIGFYFICWSPYWLLQLTVQFKVVPENSAIFLVATVIYSLPYVNTAVNPLLYAFLNKSLRQAYARTHHKRRNQSRAINTRSATDWQPSRGSDGLVEWARRRRRRLRADRTPPSSSSQAHIRHLLKGMQMLSYDATMRSVLRPFDGERIDYGATAQQTPPIARTRSSRI